MKRIKKFACLALCAATIASVCPVFASATTLAPIVENVYGYIPEYDPAEDGALSVRVNGMLVEFPDALPFIDSNNRTLIPVRAVAETLGCKVDWNGNTRTATCTKNGISVAIAIGDQNLTVTKSGKKSTVTMDTQAIISEDRTYVPIRYVAEALGAYVDYSDYWHCVGIYQDLLTADTIKMLREYPMTSHPEDTKYGILFEEGGPLTYDNVLVHAKKSYTDATGSNSMQSWYHLYGSEAARAANKTSFENALQYLWHKKDRRIYGPNEFTEAVQKTVEQLRVNESNGGNVKVMTDMSCVYQDPWNGSVVVRTACYFINTGKTEIVDFHESAGAAKGKYTVILDTRYDLTF